MILAAKYIGKFLYFLKGLRRINYFMFNDFYNYPVGKIAEKQSVGVYFLN